MHLRLILLARHVRLALTVGIICGVVAGLCNLAQAYALSETVDGVFLGGLGLGQVWPWLRLMLLVIMARAFLLMIQEVASAEVAIRVKKDLRERVFAHLLQLGPAFVRGERTGELTSTAVDGIEALDAYYSQYLPQLCVSVLVPLAILIVVFPLDPLSGVILLLTGPLIPFFMYMIGRTAESATTRQYQTLGRLSSHLLDSIQGLATLKLFGQSVSHVKNVARVADQFRAATVKVLQVSFLSALALELLATISTAIIAVEVGLRLLYGYLGFQQALFLLILAPEFYMPLRMLGLRFHAGMSGTAAGRRIFEILDTGVPDSLPAESEMRRASAPQEPRPSTSIAIRLTDVAYTYPGSDRPALENINLEVRTGERIALVGPSGAGKTTVASLILGFMRPTEGAIQVLEDVSGTAEHEGQPKVGWVPQTPSLFHDTVAANIRLGKPDATDEQVVGAAKLAELDRFVDSLPDGYGTVIGEAGARLSSGERQRLAIARALLLDAPVLVLDEPSSSLDPENEELLGESLRNLSQSRTLITIAHRLNTVRNADRIIVLEGGRIVEEGNHVSLLARGGTYATLLAARPVTVSETVRESDDALLQNPQMLGAPAKTLRPEAATAGSRDYVHVRGKHAGLPQILPFLRGSWGWIALSVVLASLTVGSSVALMGTSAWLISAAALHPSIAALQVAIVAVRFFGISRGVFRYFERLVSHNVTFRLLRNIRVWFYARLEPLAPARLMDFRVGDIMSRLMADVETLENLFVRVLAPPLTAALVLGGVSVFFMLRGQGIVAGILAVVFLLVGAGLPLLANFLARTPGSRIVQERAVLHEKLVESIQGIADILAFGRGQARLNRLSAGGASYAAAQRSMARVSGIQTALASMLVNSGLWLALLILIPRMEVNGGEGVMLASFALIVLASFEAVAGLPLAGQLWPATRAAASRLMEVVAQPPAVRSANGTPQQSPLPSPIFRSANEPPSLEFRNVSFSYPGRSRASLSGLSFHVGSGQSLGIVGASGSGKSTIGNLLLRFWDWGSGDILLDGIRLDARHPDEVREQIGYASQHTYLFDTSVFENLRLARRGISRAEVEQAARLAEVHDVIAALPGGYDALIGEHGVRLSAGERQRLGLARLILKDAPLLLLDEPTANLDAATEARLLNVLFTLMRSRTTILITHRLVGMEHLDQILVMDRGRIVEQGTHSGLLAAEGPYSRLWAFQDGGHAATLGLLAGSP